MDSLFDPYFTTKQTGEGSGMGLAVVHGIVKSLKGIIKVKSLPGEGSTFLYISSDLQPFEAYFHRERISLHRQGSDKNPFCG